MNFFTKDRREPEAVARVVEFSDEKNDDLQRSARRMPLTADTVTVTVSRGIFLRSFFTA